MDVIRTIIPGKPGTKRFQKHRGERLVAVRYRRKEKTLYTTIEITVDEREQPDPQISLISAHAFKRQQLVAIRFAWEEHAVRAAVKENGGRWSPESRAWLMRYSTAVVLGLQNRIVKGLAEKCTDVDLGFEI